MTRVLVPYRSSYGHNETMSQAVAEGVRAAGAEATIERVPEDVARRSGVRLDPPAPIAAKLARPA